MSQSLSTDAIARYLKMQQKSGVIDDYDEGDNEHSDDEMIAVRVWLKRDRFVA